MNDRTSDAALKALLASATPGPWKAVSQEHWDSGLTYTSVQPLRAEPETMRHLLMANGEHHVCRMSHTAARHRVAMHFSNAKLIALAPQLAAEVLQLREALRPFASAWNIAHASGNQNLGQLGAIARNEVSAHYFIKAAAALSPAPVVDAVKQGDAQ